MAVFVGAGCGGGVGGGLWAGVTIVAFLFLFFLGRRGLRARRYYGAPRKAGVKHYTFDPQKLGIKNADFWER